MRDIEVEVHRDNGAVAIGGRETECGKKQERGDTAPIHGS
jgi:hypothetical protein